MKYVNPSESARVRVRQAGRSATPSRSSRDERYPESDERGREGERGRIVTCISHGKLSAEEEQRNGRIKRLAERGGAGQRVAAVAPTEVAAIAVSAFNSPAEVVECCSR